MRQRWRWSLIGVLTLLRTLLAQNSINDFLGPPGTPPTQPPSVQDVSDGQASSVSTALGAGSPPTEQVASVASAGPIIPALEAISTSIGPVIPALGSDDAPSIKLNGSPLNGQDSSTPSLAGDARDGSALLPLPSEEENARDGHGGMVGSPLNGNGIPHLIVGNRREWSRDGRDIMEGIIEAYFHTTGLEWGEKRCLEQNAGQLIGDLVSTADDAVKAIKSLIKHGKNGDNLMNLGSKGQGIMMTVLDAGTKMTAIVRLAERISKECVKGDALATFNLTAQHLKNMTYVGNRLVANGADIAQVLAKTVTDWDRGDFRRVGEDIGTAMRKVLLSKAGKQPPLPEGVPKHKIIEDVMRGLTKGFFVQGTGVTMTDLAAPDVDIYIDLHKCIADNQMFFDMIFTSAWKLFAQMAANKDQFGLGKNPFQGDFSAAWMGDLAMAMVQIPLALHKCNVTSQTQQMMGEAVKSLKYAQVKFELPEERFSKKAVKLLMARAVESWTRWRFEDFGQDVGALLMELVLLIFPKKYSIDEKGILRRSLDQPAPSLVQPVGSQHQTSSSTRHRSGSTVGRLSMLPLVVGTSFFSLSACFLASRSVQIFRRRNRAWYDTVLERLPAPEALAEADVEALSVQLES